MNTITKIKQIISEHSGVEKEKITPEAHFQKDLNLGPIEVADLLALVEEELEIEIKKDEADKVRRVGDLINLVKDYTNDIKG